MAETSDILNNLISTAGSAFQSYQSAQPSGGFTPLQPGTYVGPQGQIVQTNVPFGSGSSGTIVLLALVGVFIFVFMQARK